jgi:hypothetical protein
VAWTRAARRRFAWTALIALAVALAFGTAAAYWLINPQALKARAEQGLARRLGLPVTIDDLRISVLPRPRLVGAGLVVAMPPEGRPFLEVDRFSAEIGPLSVWRGSVKAILVEGLRVVVPPGRAPSLGGIAPADAGGAPRTIAGRLDARDAVLTFLRTDPAKDPLEFRIHRLSIANVGFGRVMSFSTSLTNPVPRGLVESSGTIGPWNRGQPLALPVAGDYRFSLARLGTIRGIGGTLSSAGRYEGHLEQIVVTGTTTTPDFSLDLGGRPMPLATEFRAVVDASDGTTKLDRVRARLFATEIAVSGSIDNLPGPGRRHIDLHARVENGRIEDVLRLVVDRDDPALSGEVSLTARIRIPPGAEPVKRRLHMAGAFGLDRARFSDAGVHRRLTELSRRGQGKNRSDTVPGAVSSLAGRFTFAGGAIGLDDVTFEVPGAAIHLAGRFLSDTGELHLAGELRMQASMSSAVGGVRSIFLKPFDWLFRRDGAGAVVPIEISGTYRNPAIGVNIRRVFTRGGVDAPY